MHAKWQDGKMKRLSCCGQYEAKLLRLSSKENINKPHILEKRVIVFDPFLMVSTSLSAWQNRGPTSSGQTAWSKWPPGVALVEIGSEVRKVGWIHLMLLLDLMIMLLAHGNFLGGGFKYFVFSFLFEEIIQFDQYFSNGLKPPTSFNDGQWYRTPEAIHRKFMEIPRDIFSSQAFGCVLLSRRHILFSAFSVPNLFARWEKCGKERWEKNDVLEGAGLEFHIREHGFLVGFCWRSKTTTCCLHGTQLPGTALCRLHLLQEVQSVRVLGMLLKHGFIYISCIYIYIHIQALSSCTHFEDMMIAFTMNRLWFIITYLSGFVAWPIDIHLMDLRHAPPWFHEYFYLRSIYIVQTIRGKHAFWMILL